MTGRTITVFLLTSTLITIILIITIPLVQSLYSSDHRPNQLYSSIAAGIICGAIAAYRDATAH